MHGLYLFGILFFWFIALVWTQRAFGAARNLPRVPDLLAACFDHPGRQTAGAGPAPITVIVPACNEAAAIEATLRSLLAQTIPVEILAVDDRSTDATGAIMERVAAGPVPAGKLLRVIHIAALPEGWLGKPHAMTLAAREAATPWLLFTDGDVMFASDALERALHYAQTAGVDHLVLFPTLILRTWGERMMSAVFQSLTLLAWRPWKIADPKARHESVGMGAFNLVRSEVYRVVGGFESAPFEVLEDLRFGHAVKSAGYRQHLVLGRGLVRLHWAAGVLGMVRNLTKNTFATFRFRSVLLLGAWLGLLILCFAPLAGLFAPWPIRTASLVSLVMIAWLYRAASRSYNRIHPVYSVTFPLAAGMVLYAMLRSWLVTLGRGGVVWRGTFYPLAELRRHAGPLR